MAAQRARRMAGQGLGPLVNKQPEPKAPSVAAAALREQRLPRRGSPSYDPYRSPPAHRGLTRLIISEIATMHFGALWLKSIKESFL